MKSFRSPGDFARHLLSLNAAVVAAETAGLLAGAGMVQDDAKARLGHQQNAVGPFPAWPALSPVTVEERVSQGFSANGMLRRDGELERHIRKSVGHPHAAIGVPAEMVQHTYQTKPRDIGDIALALEMGSLRHNIPPRPFLGPAAHVQIPAIADAIAQAVGRAIAGLPPLKPRKRSRTASD